MKYIVSSPSRTGSVLLCQILRAAEISDILHTHDCFFTVDNPASAILLFSYRQDIFKSIMSALVAKRTNLYVSFDSTMAPPPIDPFYIDCADSDSEFQKQYRWHKWYIQSHDLNKPYHRVETIYLEDFIKNYDYVFKKLDLNQSKPVWSTIQSVYNYKEVIINHQQCKDVFDYLEQTETFVQIPKPYDPNLPN